MADPDLQMGGGGHPDTEIRGGGSLKKNFLALWASVWSKNKGGPGPIPWISHCLLKFAAEQNNSSNACQSRENVVHCNQRLREV